MNKSAEVVNTKWREVIQSFYELGKAVESFQEAFSDEMYDYLGPAVQTACQMRLHQRLPVHVLEDLIYFEARHGSLRALMPEQPEPTDSVVEDKQSTIENVPPEQDQATEPVGGKTGGSRVKSSTVELTAATE